MTTTKRKGWRKGKSREGMMLLPEGYHNTARNLTVQRDKSGGWFYYGDGMNSLCLTPPQSFAGAIEAMKAAEERQDKRDRGQS